MSSFWYCLAPVIELVDAETPHRLERIETHVGLGGPPPPQPRKRRQRDTPKRRKAS